MCVSITTISNSSSWFQCKGDIKYSSRKQTYVDIAYTLYQKGTKKFDIEGAVNQARNMVLLPSTYIAVLYQHIKYLYIVHISMIPQHGFFQFPLINVIQILIKPLELKRHIIHLVKWSFWSDKSKNLVHLHRGLKAPQNSYKESLRLWWLGKELYVGNLI